MLRHRWSFSFNRSGDVIWIRCFRYSMPHFFLSESTMYLIRLIGTSYNSITFALKPPAPHKIMPWPFILRTILESRLLFISKLDLKERHKDGIFVLVIFFSKQPRAATTIKFSAVDRKS